VFLVRAEPFRHTSAALAAPRRVAAMVSAAALRAFALVSAVKLALVPCYRSTDFEVHRNWLAVTGTLPMREWYVDATSEWTLDYPPLFAHFERFLALFARLADPGMLTVQSQPYASFACVVFQRCSVIAADAVLALGAFRAASRGAVAATNRRTGEENTRKHDDDATYASSPVALAALFVLFNPGLLLVDHVHFQYNGVALGLQLCAVAAANEGAPLLAAFLFSVLVHFKHVFAYAAPAFAAHLIAHHTPGLRTLFARQKSARRMKDSTKKKAFRAVATRLAAYAGVAAGVTAVSLGPFVAFGQLQIVTHRLFPFGRGLSHAYWAPNFWAMYNAADKTLAKALRIPSPLGNLAGGMTGHGGTGGATHVALPRVSPRATFFLTLAASAPAIYAHAFRTETSSLKPSALPRLVAHVSLCAFVFGWHVHEKAVLMVVAPLGVAVALDAADNSVSIETFNKRAGDFVFLTVTGTYALFPLLFEPREWPIKVSALALWTVASLGAARDASHARIQTASGTLVNPRILTNWQSVYLFVLLPLVEVYVCLVHEFLFGTEKMAFLPLALVSVTCASGVCFVWVQQVSAYVAEVAFSGHVGKRVETSLFVRNAAGKASTETR
jgi:alpha-1,3-glucosyltransferase